MPRAHCHSHVAHERLGQSSISSHVVHTHSTQGQNVGKIQRAATACVGSIPITRSNLAARGCRSCEGIFERRLGHPGLHTDVRMPRGTRKSASGPLAPWLRAKSAIFAFRSPPSAASTSLCLVRCGDLGRVPRVAVPDSAVSCRTLPMWAGREPIQGSGVGTHARSQGARSL